MCLSLVCRSSWGSQEEEGVGSLYLPTVESMAYVKGFSQLKQVWLCKSYNLSDLGGLKRFVSKTPYLIEDTAIAPYITSCRVLLVS